jgi:cytochrome o ubiquinol oxidase subunit I
MPCNTSAGFVLGMLAFVFVFGFALIWYIWWLAALSALGMLATVIARSFNDDLEYVIPAAEVARTEAELRARRAGAGAEVPAGAATAPQPVPEG